MTINRTESKRTEETPDHLGTVYAPDPVCGMDVGVADAQYQSEVAGEIHYFCSSSCKTKFDTHPEKYL